MSMISSKVVGYILITKSVEEKVNNQDYLRNAQQVWDSMSETEKSMARGYFKHMNKSGKGLPHEETKESK